jgi:hypothetical protein
MEGGEISGNTIRNTYNGSNNTIGGGVLVNTGASFTMQGGKISGNTTISNSYAYGGGVYVFYNNGTFIMEGGEISGNTAISNGLNGAYAYGGGVYVREGGSFRKTGGSIYGSDADNSLKNTADSANPYGHAVWYTKDSGYYRDTTLNTGDNIRTDTLPTDPGAANSEGNWIKK